jgi:hypothetical protein
MPSFISSGVFDFGIRPENNARWISSDENLTERRTTIWSPNVAGD